LYVATHNGGVNAVASDFRMMLQNTMCCVRTSGVSRWTVREKRIGAGVLEEEVHQIALALLCGNHVGLVFAFWSLLFDLSSQD
jgi:hypothetical protein